MKKKYNLLIIFLLMIVITLSGCYNYVEEYFYISQIETIYLNVGDIVPYNVLNIDNNILEENEEQIIAKKIGNILIETDKGKFFLIISDNISDIQIKCNQRLIVGETTNIETTIYPLHKNQEVEYQSMNNDVITVTSNGVIEAKSIGIATVKVNPVIDKNIVKEITFIVLDKDEEYYEKVVNTIVNNKENEKDFSNTNDVIKPIIDTNINALVGVKSYSYITNTSIFASGIIYKMDVYLQNGEILQNIKDINNYNNIARFKYYVITNRHVIEKMDIVHIYLGDNKTEELATVIEYDNKIDLAVLTFESIYYFNTAKIGNSDNLQKGEFVISIGNGQSQEYYHTSNFGVLSSYNRYISVDTDGDNVSDWDSEYLQHDASINEGDSGGALMNLKGEVIGINTTKINGYQYNNMSFAIPINLVMNIVEQLEQGIRPERLQLGIEILDVSKYQLNKEQYLAQYPNIKIPDDLKYGFYINKITEGGFADQANMQVGDIIVKFNDINIKYTYQLRLELNKYLKGSGEKASVTILRNNEEIVLEVVF